MKSPKLSFSCVNCGYMAAKWLGCCPECKNWNSFEESQVLMNFKKSKSQKQSQTLQLNQIEGLVLDRFQTGIKEFDRVVGGGITKGSLILIGGQPGIGKSTLLMEISKSLVKKEKVLYVSGEESTSQVASRCKRMEIESQNLYVLHETIWEEMVEHIKEIKPDFLIIDSIQTTLTKELASPAGSTSQVREVTHEVMNYCKANTLSCFIVGHINKEGAIAGPKLLEHMVDTVIYFEGDELGQYRKLRVIKNRFGNTNEVGVFEMFENGLRSVENPTICFLSETEKKTFGSTLTCIMEGSRAIFAEVQSLVVENKYGNGCRTTQGFDGKRLAMLVAIIDKYFQIPLSYNDIYLNVAGGMKLSGTDSDLAVIASLISSYKKRKINSKTVFLGEVGLTGEVRAVSFIENRLAELELLNCEQVITSNANIKKIKKKYNLKIIGIDQASELQDVIT